MPEAHEFVAQLRGSLCLNLFLSGLFLGWVVLWLVGFCLLLASLYDPLWWCIFLLCLLKYMVVIWNVAYEDHVLALYILFPSPINLFQITLNLSYFMIWILDFKFISRKDGSTCANMHVIWNSLKYWIGFPPMLIDTKWKQHTEICNDIYLLFTSKWT